ncbi:hypothetical protein [Actinophytocola glycyrrhizae]|uniref:Uncharacterized protein n=1 Tax=Actinophytocola glycyrrhizae TaxID=2044873 RepID=A0ABV9S8N3_9PSEU
MLGVQRPALNKILEELERDGVPYAAIDLLDQEGLRERAGWRRGRRHAPAGRVLPHAGISLWQWAWMPLT